jgi:hypothetical protein
MSKICIQCKQELPIDQFSFCRSRKRPRSERRNSRCRACMRLYMNERQKLHGKEIYQHLIEKYGRQYFTDAAKKNRRELRRKAIEILNPNEKPHCKICGFVDDTPEYNILQIDHINNNGYEERKNNKGYTLILYRKIIKMVPEDALKEYQTLCPAHNWLKRIGIEGKNYKLIKIN